jgi:succinate-semialdehyde dehydrogenase/glutarate-semialdehyde dehydrogenase
VQIPVTARMLNSGQSCLAAKSFILVESIHDEFVQKFAEADKTLKSGEPMNDETSIGLLARKDLADQLDQQVQNSIKLGAILILRGKQNNCHHKPTIILNATLGMDIFIKKRFSIESKVSSFLNKRSPENR